VNVRTIGATSFIDPYLRGFLTRSGALRSKALARTLLSAVKRFSGYMIWSKGNLSSSADCADSLCDLDVVFAPSILFPPEMGALELDWNPESNLMERSRTLPPRSLL